MSDQPVYAYYPVFRATAALRAMDEMEALNAAHDAQILFKEWEDRVHVRGHYSTAAFRPDADLLMWWVASSPDDVQELLTSFRRSALGRQLEQAWAFMGVTRPPETAPDHRPAFVRGDAPRRFVSVPSSRTVGLSTLPFMANRGVLRAAKKYSRPRFAPSHSCDQFSQRIP